jgi:YVTN family beta-propeller protein
MLKHCILPLIASGLFFFLVSCRNPGAEQAKMDSLARRLDAKRMLLPNGWSLSAAGKSMPLGDFPMNLVVSRSGKFMAVTNNGQGRQSLQLIDPATERILDDVEIPKSWLGLVFNREEDKLFASGGNDNRIVVYSITDGKLIKTDSIVLGRPWPVKISPAGIALDDESGKLFIATKEDSALYIADLASKKSRRFPLGHEAYACVLSPDRRRVYVSLWGGDKVAVVDAGSGALLSTIAVGSHPNDMVVTKDGRYLFVAQGNDNSVSMVDTPSGKVIEVFSSALYPGSPAGSTPNAVALSDDESRLYVANADNNCLAVFDVREPGKSRSLGFIPTDWYPTSVKVRLHSVWVTNGKGGRSWPNPKGPNPYVKRTDSTQYIASLFKGTLSIIPEPDDEELRIYSRAALTNSPYNRQTEQTAEGVEGNPIPRKRTTTSPINYVFYVIKENRTYDQVFGDIREGNGDSTLCLFPSGVTPNHHALARQFVLLDNFYVNAEVSADGHNWSMAAYANDYVEKTWPTSYGDRGGTYDYEGSRKIAFPKDGFIWDYCKRAGLRYRSYGEFVEEGKTGVPSLVGHFAPHFPGFDLTISDLKREALWEHDFDSLLNKNAVPAFSTVRLPNDHTAGARVGQLTPRAFVAENDLALGKMIEHLSRSSIWKASAVFVVEDDAQNGPDHVDAHRSIALVISPYVRRKAHVTRMYSTASLLRTMELILGLPPMSQYDAGAPPMWECFGPTPDNTVYTALPASYDLHEKNVRITMLSKRSEQFNLAVEDAAPDIEFNSIIWKTIRGISNEMPSPRRSAFVRPATGEEDDD